MNEYLTTLEEEHELGVCMKGGSFLAFDGWGSFSYFRFTVCS